MASFRVVREMVKINPILVNDVDEELNSSLTWACIRGHTQTVKELIEGGADMQHRLVHNYELKGTEI